MNINFGGSINNLGITAAKINEDKTKIDTKTELNVYMSGYEAIKARAIDENEKYNKGIDLEDLESTMKSELAKLMGADFGQTIGVENKGTQEEPLFSEEDISLENMMALLEPEEGLNIDKVRDQNNRSDNWQIRLKEELDELKTVSEFGFDGVVVNSLMEFAPDALKYIANAIKDGRAEEIGEKTIADVNEFGTDPKNLDLANMIRTLNEQGYLS